MNRRWAAAGVSLVLVVVGPACGRDSTPVTTGASTTVSTSPSTSPSTRTVALGQDFSIDLGETVDVAEESLTVTYVEVLSDNRCPPDVMCIVAGNATLAVSVAGGGGDGATLQLNSTEGPTSAAYMNYTVTLVDLDFGTPPTARLRVSRS